MSYDHSAIEKKWRAYWEKNNTFYCDTSDFSKPKYYCLDMFPYPSGQGLHVGHPEGYTASDIVSRMKRMQGFNVLHPMGWDAFGLPAEQFAIQNNQHPEEFTRKNIAHFKDQIQALGFSYDWSKELATIDPGYYKWTQWIFIQLYKHAIIAISLSSVVLLGTILSFLKFPLTSTTKNSAWMSSLPDSTDLASLSIPGSHAIYALGQLGK